MNISDRARGRLAFLALLSIGLGMAWLSWRKWADPLIDYGLQHPIIPMVSCCVTIVLAGGRAYSRSGSGL